MKTVVIASLAVIACGIAAATSPDDIYVRIEPVIGDERIFTDRGLRTGCYIGPDRECSGVFYIRDGGFGAITGSMINDLVGEPDFELVYSLTLKEEGGSHWLVGSAYTMELSQDGVILGGDRTVMRQRITPGEEIVMAHPAGTSDDGKSIFLQISSEPRRTVTPDEPAAHAVTLISTHMREGGHSTKSWHDQLDSVHLFRSAFRLLDKNAVREKLRYDVEVRLTADPDSPQSPTAPVAESDHKSWLTLTRTYSIDTLGNLPQRFSPHLTFRSVYSRSLSVTPGKILKLIFPPDTPSVRGFDIEDTLIIAPD